MTVKSIEVLSDNNANSVSRICNGQDSDQENINVTIWPQIPTVKNVTCLRLSSCNLTEFCVDVTILAHLTEVDLSRNFLSDLPAIFLQLKKLRILNLSYNEFRTLPKVMEQGPHLIRSLNMSYNMLTDFNSPPKCHHILQDLNLSHNQLGAPPPWLLAEAPSSLLSLNLSWNPLFTYPNVQHHLDMRDNYTSLIRQKQMISSGVKRLDLTNTGFGDHNMYYLVHFPSLEWLAVTTVRPCPPSLQCCLTFRHFYLPPLLHYLDLSDSDLGTVLPTETNQLLHLRELNIAHNKDLDWLPTAVYSFKRLEVLSAHHTKISFLSSEITQISSTLKRLYLSDNHMTSVDCVEELVNLEVLDLYNNDLTQLPCLESLDKLISLDLGSNCFKPPLQIKLVGRIVEYSDLKNNLRNSIKDPSRHDEVKEKVPYENDDYDSEYFDYSSSNGEYDEFEETSKKQEIIPENEVAETFHEEELWTSDDNELDNSFDPQEWEKRVYIERTSSCESLTGETPYEIKSDPHYFTPHRRRSRIFHLDTETMFREQEDGQFDDI